MSLSFESASRLARQIRDKQISSRELTEHFIQRIEKFDPALNAVVVRDFERARESAAAADEELARGEIRGPLHGLPMTIKEAYDIEGLPTTWGVPDFAKNRASSDSASVRSYKAAGAHFLGKTNVPLQLADFQSYNDIYGMTRNPWNLERTPGGSSGGSSAALASGMTALESGSDIGGSIRNPAHFCGIYGHKPTWGIVPSEGHALPGMLAAPDIAVVGPMARSAEDLALALELLAGADRFNSAGWKLALPRPEKRLLADFRVAVWPTQDFAPVSREMGDRVQSLADRLARLGATVSDSARPDFDVRASHRSYLYMLNGVMAAGTADAELEKIREGLAGLDPATDNDQITMLRAALQSHGEWLRNDNFRARLRLAWSAFFQDWDILLCPIMPTAAFPHDHSPFESRTLSIDGDERSYMDQIFWAGLVTGGYLPSTVFPTGPSTEGLPIGLQAVSSEFQDFQCIEFARLMADQIGGFVAPAGYED